MHDLLAMPLTFMADTSSATSIIHAYVVPLLRTLCVLASAACVVFLIHGGFVYMTSSGKPERLDQAKRIIRNTLIGLLIVLGAAVINEVLAHAYHAASATSGAQLPQLQAIPPDSVSNGLVAVVIKAVTGLLNNIIQSVAQPFLHALSFFTNSTGLMAENSAVFNLWLVMVGICDGLFVLVVALLGFHVMSASTFGFDEIDVKHLLPRFGLIFLGMNTSIFLIDTFIGISNAMISAVNAAGGANSVWDTLSGVVKDSGGQGVAALLIMVVFLILSVILLVYYVGRLVTLYIGAVLSPAVLLAWLVPGFRDFAETAAKTYIVTIFVLFVHVVILQLAASLFVGMAAGSGNNVPDTLMAMVTGLATIVALLKTQSLMMQFSYVSGGMRNARKLGGQFMNGVGYMTGKGRGLAVAAVSGSTAKQDINPLTRTSSGKTPIVGSSGGSSVVRPPKQQQKGGVTVIQSTTSGRRSGKTGTTTVAPRTNPEPKVAKPLNRPEDKS